MKTFRRGFGCNINLNFQRILPYNGTRLFKKINYTMICLRVWQEVIPAGSECVVNNITDHD